jgi:HAMP domain-containing protein
LDQAPATGEAAAPPMPTMLAARPVILLAGDMPSGESAGGAALVAVLTTERLAGLLQRAIPGEGGHIYLLDPQGQPVLPAGAIPMAARDAGSQEPGTRGATAPARLATTTAYQTPAGERLASAASVAPLGWSIVADIPKAAALGPLRQARDVTFLVLWPTIALAVLGGIMVARWLTAPLAALAAAARQLAAGDISAPLPRSHVAEVAALTADFETMRDRLEVRTVEREQVADALRHSASLLDKAEELADLGSWEWDVESGRLAWSEGSYRVFGVAPADFDERHPGTGWPSPTRPTGLSTASSGATARNE